MRSAVGLLSPSRWARAHTLSREFWNQSAHVELFAVQHQKGITYLRLLISSPSVRPAEIWNLIYFEQVGRGNNINHLIFILPWQSLFRTGPERNAGEKWGSWKVKVTSRKGEGEIWSDTWKGPRHIRRQTGVWRDHLNKDVLDFPFFFFWRSVFVYTALALH